MKTAATVVDLADLPIVLTMQEIAWIYRISQATIRRGLQAGTFAPRPWEKYPYRWRREDVIADLRKPRAERRRPHGFASLEKRPAAKATLTPRKTTRSNAR